MLILTLPPSQQASLLTYIQKVSVGVVAPARSIGGEVATVLADFELQPELDLDSDVGNGDDPELVIGDATVVRGVPTRKTLKGNIRRRLSDW